MWRPFAPARGTEQGPGGRAGGRARLPERATSGAPTDARRPAGARAPPGPTIGSVIHDVDQLLEKLVRRDALNGSSVDLVFDAPTKDWVARRNGPAVDLYLYDIREDLQRRVPAWEDVRDTQGVGHAPAAAAAPVPALVPRDRVDPAARGRAPPAVVAARLLPAQPDDQGRGPRRRRSTRPTCPSTSRSASRPARSGRSPTSGRRSAASSSRRSTSSSSRRSSSTRDAYIGPPVLEGPSIGISSTGGASERAERAGAGEAPRRSSSTPSPTELLPANAGAKDGGVRLRVSGVRRPPRAVSAVAGDAGDDRRRAADADLERGPPDPSLALPARAAVAGRAPRAGRGRPPPRRRRRSRTTGSAACTSPTTRSTALLDARRAGPLVAPDRRRGRPSALRDGARGRAAEADGPAAATSGSATSPARSASSRSTSSCSWSRSRPTSTRASSGCTATSTTTSRAAGRASASRSSCAAAPATADGAPIRARLGPRRRSSAGGLLLVEDADRPFLTRSLRVPDRVTAHLLGDDSPDPVVEALLTTSVAVDARRGRRRRARARGRRAASSTCASARARPGASLGWTALARLGRPALALDLGAHVAGRRRRRRSPPRRRARRGCAAPGSSPGRSRRSSSAARPPSARSPSCRARCILVGTRDWDPAWSREPPLVVDAPVPDRRRAPRAVGRVARRRRARGVRPRRGDDRVPPHARADRPGGAGRRASRDGRRRGR